MHGLIKLTVSEYYQRQLAGKDRLAAVRGRVVGVSPRCSSRMRDL